MTMEGPAAVEESIRFLQTAPSLPPLALSEGLCRAAADHLEDIGPKGLATHVGSNNSSMQVCVCAACTSSARRVLPSSAVLPL